MKSSTSATELQVQPLPYKTGGVVISDAISPPHFAMILRSGASGSSPGCNFWTSVSLQWLQLAVQVHSGGNTLCSTFLCLHASHQTSKGAYETSICVGRGWPVLSLYCSVQQGPQWMMLSCRRGHQMRQTSWQSWQRRWSRPMCRAVCTSGST